MGYPTVESHPWRPRITSIGADLSPVTVTPRVVSHIFPKRRRAGSLTGLSHRLPPAYCSEWCPPPRRGRAGQDLPQWEAGKMTLPPLRPG
ncbi:hypothetical protein JYU34_007168 [Plutella xylostella]|uniref:Uncharacterized protein n=1 Tax=Plutella xylostella TaxID=51655 RepID=A0ABQ7QPT1_PLUXY|nr:hypothetical protein JYU34_007168 [Plutella xylostella]